MRHVDSKSIAEYTKNGWWGTESAHSLVRKNAVRNPTGEAIVTANSRWTWRDYDSYANEIAGLIVAMGVPVDDRVALKLPDGLLVHAALIATARAGVVAVGIGSRAGAREMAHLLSKTGARTLITGDSTDAKSIEELTSLGARIDFHVILTDNGVADIIDLSNQTRRSISPGRASLAEVAERSLGPNDLSILNSTSGTTGLPKCVTQFDNRWLALSRLALEAGNLTETDVFLGAVPTPFGFGLWTSHYAPALLGVPTVVMPKYSTNEMISLIERERVTVLCCVSTQFKMLLNSQEAQKADLSSLRVMFTGGEAVPYESAAAFEKRTGATVLQFYGSNETGALSYTTLDDPRSKRLRTAGQLIPDMHTRLFDEAGQDVTATGGPGRPAGIGPLLSGGYYDDREGNRQLYTDDGLMLMGDLVTIDDDGYLSVVGRTSDIIIRGGKNVSAAQVEAEVDAHPAVSMCSVVAIPDSIFGERVCVVVSLRSNAVLELDELVVFLQAKKVSKELWPEHLLIRDALPRASGGKIAKGELREWATVQIARNPDGGAQAESADVSRAST